MKTIITFRIPNAWDNVLYKILQPINITNYYWRLNDNECYKEKEGEFKTLFCKNSYIGKEFLEIINTESYIIHCEILGVNQYQKDFNIRITIVDSIFAKITINSILTEKIVSNLKMQKFEHIIVTTESNI